MNKVDKIRKRASYNNFKELYSLLKPLSLKKLILIKILQLFYKFLDRRYFFGTATNASYAKESLNQICKDISSGVE